MCQFGPVQKEYGELHCPRCCAKLLLRTSEAGQVPLLRVIEAQAGPEVAEAALELLSRAKKKSAEPS